ncbi:MAG: adenosylcobinamide-GDP ribazoletransferase [Eubacteriales bacterium]|nr:adenosylcobinamide-GDP ribazoletransferase [Eubacteriales bacterium]
MRLLRSLALAFSTYSKIPMPQCAFTEDNLRYSLCFFPAVGALIGASLLLLRYAAAALSMGALLTGALLTIAPRLISGGIHMDGFIDAMDALSSGQPRERKLEILRDPHVGAFGIMGCAAYLLLMLGVLAEPMAGGTAYVVALSFVLSRALSGLMLLTLKSARPTGLLATFKGSAQTGAVRLTLALWALLAAALMLLSSPARGARALIASALMLLYYRFMAYRQFGGITGDLAGFFLQICELAAMAAAVIGW